MGVANSMNINGKDIEMDPRLVWQRWTTGGINSGDLANTMAYELNVYPPALFESKGVMLTPDKSSMAHYIVGEIGIKDPSLNATITSGQHRYVVDGCAQLFRLKWQKGWSYSRICQEYNKMFSRKYPANQTHIFFDGYKASTKDATRTKRSKARRDIYFDLSMPCEVSRDDFLSNTFNKDRLIKHLTTFLTSFTVTQIEADAVVLIFRAAIDYSKKSTTILTGEDTDLLVLCIALAPQKTKSLFLRPEEKLTGLKQFTFTT